MSAIADIFGQEHAVVEFEDEGLRQVSQGDEVEDVMVLVERAVHLDGHAPVVAVDALALVAVEGDEVPGAEDEVVLGDADFEAFRALRQSP
jgi:hypothetical protein